MRNNCENTDVSSEDPNLPHIIQEQLMNVDTDEEIKDRCVHRYSALCDPCKEKLKDLAFTINWVVVVRRRNKNKTKK